MRRLFGSQGAREVIQRRGTRYEQCPDWVPAAVDRCVESGLVPRPTAVVWHARRTSERWGTCWPQEGRVHVYPWAGHRVSVDDTLDIDVSGELREGHISSRMVAGAQDADDIEDTLAHELAHLVHAKHDASHGALTARLADIVRRRAPGR